jgi:uncharacterized membrane protein YfcA
MLSKIDLRNANIAIAVGAVVVFVGGFLARDAGEGAMQLVGLLTLAATFGTLFGLNARDERRKRREDRDQ